MICQIQNSQFHFFCLPLQPQKRGVAQLVAFLVWDQAVAGSSPVTSTHLVKEEVFLTTKEIYFLFFCLLKCLE